MCDYGIKRSTFVQEKLGKKTAFCDHCRQRILLECRQTQELAWRCEVKYVENETRSDGNGDGDVTMAGGG